MTRSPPGESSVPKGQMVVMEANIFLDDRTLVCKKFRSSCLVKIVIVTLPPKASTTKEVGT